MSAIDFHAHAFPDKLAPRAIAALEAACPWTAVADGTAAALLESMDAADVDVSAVCSIATRPQQVKDIFNWCRKVRSDRLDPLPSVHPDTPKPDKWIARFADEHFPGIKLHPMHQGFAADEPRLDPIYAAAAEAGLFVQIHSGCDIGFPADDDRAAPERLARVASKHPELTLVCAHLGGWRRWDDVERHLVGRPVWLETSFSLGPDDLPPERAARLIARHGADRVMFGSDWPWRSQAQERARVAALPLPEKDIRRILWTNAARLLGY